MVLARPHGLMFGNLRYAIYLPCFTTAGSTAFGWDRESSKQVWSTQEGYSAYRDFYRNIGYDLDLEYLAHFLRRTESENSPVSNTTGSRGAHRRKRCMSQGGQIEWPITMPVILNYCFPEEMVSP